MKAMIFNRYGSPDVLKLAEVKKPVPKDNEVLIRAKATTVTSGDCRLRASKTPLGFWFLFRLAFGITRPRKNILGMELAGEIEAVGKNVTKYKVGDEVFIFNGASMGCYAEYICVSEDGVMAKKPENVSFDEIAAVPFGATTALYYLRDLAKVEKGQKVLINGASGGVGTFAVQLAKYYGAEVTAVCSGRNADMVRSIGADHVIDYTKEDFTKNGELYDVIFDSVGNLSFSMTKKSLVKKGKLLLVVAALPAFFRVLWTSFFSSKKVIAGVAPEKTEDLLFLKELIEAGKLKAVIDRRFAFEELPEAHRYVDKGRKKGNVVISLESVPAIP